jgi:hypothetical protein
MNGTQVMTTTKQFDFLNRLRSISSSGSQPLSPVSYAYSYNEANQRTRTGLADSSYWRYEYDSLGQVHPVRYESTILLRVCASDHIMREIQAGNWLTLQ